METTTMSHNVSRKQTSRLAQRVGFVFIALLLTVSSGCSVYMASHQPAKKDTALLSPGIPRSLLLVEFGEPVSTEMKDGKRVDYFSFFRGSSETAKTSRAVFYGVADVFTLGLFEVVGTPVETSMKGDKLTYEVTYDANDNVQKVVQIGQGASAEPANQSPQVLLVPEVKDKRSDTTQTEVEQTAPTQ